MRSKLQSSYSSVTLRCPKDIFYTSRQPIQKHVKSHKKIIPLNRVQSRQIQPIKLKPYPLQDINQLRRKLKNVEFLTNCIYLQIDKLQAKQNKPIDINNRNNSEKFEQNIMQMETLIENSDFFKRQIQKKKQVLAQNKQTLMMMRADQESRYFQQTELLLQKEDIEETLFAYSEQYQQQNEIIDIQNQLEEELKEIQVKKTQYASKMEDIQQKLNQLNLIKNTTNHKYLQQKIHQMRIQLFEKQEKLNSSCKIYRVKNIRELICSFYTLFKNKDNQKSAEEGIQLWLGKNQLISSFQKYIKQKHVYENKQLIKQFSQYVEILKKMESAIKRNRKNTQEQIMDRVKIQENQLISGFNEIVERQKILKRQIQQASAQLIQLFNEQKRLCVQSAEVKNMKKFVSKLDSQQKHRVQCIKKMKFRFKQIKSASLSKDKQTQINNLVNAIRYQQLSLDTLHKEFHKIERNKLKLETQIETQKKFQQNCTKRQQNLEALNILYKKINKLQQRKKQLLQQVTDKQKQISNQEQNLKYSNYFTQRTPSKINLKSTPSTKPHPLQETIRKLNNLKQSLMTDRGSIAAVMASRMLHY